MLAQQRPRLRPELATFFRALITFVHLHVRLQLGTRKQSFSTGLAFEGLLAGVRREVYFKVVFHLELLLAVVTDVCLLRLPNYVVAVRLVQVFLEVRGARKSLLTAIDVTHKRTLQSHISIREITSGRLLTVPVCELTCVCSLPSREKLAVQFS